MDDDDAGGVLFNDFADADSNNLAGGDSSVETEEVGWLSRLKEALFGVVFGLILVIASVVGLFWNEGRAVTTARSLAEGAEQVVSVDAGRIDPANAGRLVHVSGDLKAKAPLFDSALGVGEQAIRLDRVVETLQWKETRSTQTNAHVGGAQTRTTTYSYEPTWAPGRINSQNFHQPAGHVNPEPRFHRAEFLAREPELGAFRPGAAVLRLLPAEDLPIPGEALQTLKSHYGDSVHIEDGKIFLGADPSAPRIGDTRVSYKIVRPGPASVIGAQAGADFAPFMTSAGKTVLLASSGLVPADQMFRAAERQNIVMGWVLRAVGVLFMWIGFCLLTRPFVVFADFIPLLGDLVGMGAGLVSVAATFLLAPATIAVAWFYYQPMVSALIMIAGLAVAYSFKAGAKGPGQAPPPPRGPLQGGAPLGAEAARAFGRR